MEALRTAEPAVSDDLYNRARDNWEPLLAIADACGGDWPKDAREAALNLAHSERNETHGTQLLADLRGLFKKLPDDRNISSEWIIKQLAKLQDRPWPEYSRGEPITTGGLSRLLKPFKIKSKQVRVGGKWSPSNTWIEGSETPEERRMQGYQQDQFKFVFKRYLPPSHGGNS
jgi:hypothetical protein